MRALLLFLCLVLSPPASAQPVSDPSGLISIEVMPGWRESRGTHVAGLRVRLKPGWKTYWRRAGELGIAPRMDWRRSRNAAAVEARWPTPSVFRSQGAMSLGYTEDFVLPLVIRVGRSARDVDLRGRLDLGVCAEICVPVRLDVSGRLPKGGAPDPEIRAALADRPRPSRARATCTLRPTEAGIALTGRLDLPPLGGPETVVFELDDPSLWVTDAEVRREGGALVATSEVMGGDRGIAVDRRRVRITVIGGSGAVEIEGCRGG
ncbi:hypothetical protein JQC91_01615 [Jannaschia sp. Os4]|uniref:protein-disulfide reductase DsbD domain-containing protein n=1 Tax=Jannaschia sp. Os4 TaxID=2807617 RepID=UPI0019398BD2|nr:protein-disulfide reductase DsbD domain-containing protein [Jannaschia sp. Os4]MBM2574989.1 hypothetical protein [Jannaschia sp. Os4]